jgi:translocator protein
MSDFTGSGQGAQGGRSAHGFRSATSSVQGLSRQDVGWLLGFLGATFGAAGVGAALTNTSVDTWYRRLRKPRLNPPDWVFGPVWTLLYLMMAIAAWLVRRRAAERPEQRARDGTAALAAWAVQLALNVAWSGVFFGARRPDGGLVVIAALWAAIAATTALFARITRPAAALLVPYLIWVTFASYLNTRLWQLNRSR